jgi:hypothetical protein
MDTVMQAVRTYNPPAQHAAAATPDLSASALESQEVYEARIRGLWSQADYDRLEAEAREARTKQLRIIGGTWKLFNFYDSITNFNNGCPSEEECRDTVQALQKWVAARPDSITARVALAQAYSAYAWSARGSDYANGVSDSQWKLFHQRIAMAKATLVQAASLKQKCPIWYQEMLVVARAESWNKEQTREVFDQAVAMEPFYYPFYREYGTYLFPRWFGQEGDTQALGEEALKKYPGQDGSMLYFRVATLFICGCGDDSDNLQQMSWPKIEEGYENNNRLYGANKQNKSRYAYLAFVFHDKSAAKQAFDAIGEDWDPIIWGDASSFQTARDWAATPLP